MMRTNSWTEEQIDVLKDQYPVIHDVRLLCSAFGKTYKAIKSKAKVLQLKRIVPPPTLGKTRATASDDQYIKDNYLKINLTAIARHLGYSETLVKGRMKFLNLVTPKEIKDRFRAEAIAKTRATRFYKGHLPHNTKTDFEITVRADNRGVKYKFIRIRLGNWTPLHRYRWEQANGMIPPKMKLIFKDGDTMNCDIENLELLTPGQLMKRNSYHNYPKPIAEMVQLRGALNRKINKHLKKLTDEKQNQ